MDLSFRVPVLGGLPVLSRAKAGTSAFADIIACKNSGGL